MNEEEGFQRILSILRSNRELYGSILKQDPRKTDLISKANTGDFHSLVSLQLNLCETLLKEDALLAEIMPGFDHEGDGGFKRESTDAVRSFEGVRHITIHLRSLQELLKRQLSADIFRMAPLLEDEKMLHAKIRRAFFYLLRNIGDYLRNLELKRPLIYVVVPAHNEERYIVSCLRRIRDQTYPNKKVVVVDSASHDSTIRRSSPYTYEYVRVDVKGLGIARNTGTRYALSKGAEIVVHLDADSLMRRDLLEKVWEAVYLDQKLAGISLTYLNESHWKARIFTVLHNINRIVWKIPSAFAFGTREVSQQIKFRETMQLGGDVDWAHRVIESIGSSRFKVITASWIITSARRFEKHGYLRTVMRWAETWPFGKMTGKKDDTYFE